jgi:protein SCO1/2
VAATTASGNRWTQGLALLLLLAIYPACHEANSRETARYPVTGTVVRFDRGSGTVVLAHDAIDGFMDAMTMPFEVVGPLPGVQPGDLVAGVLVLRAGGTRLEDVVVTRKASGPIVPAPPPVLPGPPVGAEVPDFRLRNQHDEPIQLHEFRGRAVLLTFIYTRCPLPDFCPLMMKHLDAVNRSLDSRPDLGGRVRLLGVSVDPEHDTPKVLEAYGKAFITGPDPFLRLDLATGAPDAVRQVATFFGLTYSRDAAQITHSLSTAIIGADGRVVALLPSNSWRPDDAVKMLQTHLESIRP